MFRQFSDAIGGVMNEKKPSNLDTEEIEEIEALTLSMNTTKFLTENCVYHGDSRILLKRVRPESIALSVWSPPYFVGKSYEKDLSFEDWQTLLRQVIVLHYPLIKPGGFLAINVADILCFKDMSMPRIMAENVSRRKINLTKDQIVSVQKKHPTWNRNKLAEYFGCSEQTIDRRLNGNNIRGGKYQSQTKVFLIGGFIQEIASKAGFYLYDRRVWIKDAAWENSKWHTISYRPVDEFDYVYIFWKPGTTKVNRNRLRRQEWVDWGSRAVWQIPSVRSNADHDAKYPVELPRRVIKLLTETNETVLDCFIGSGTTAIAALSQARKYIGIDKEKKSVEVALKAISDFEQDRYDENAFHNRKELQLEISSTEKRVVPERKKSRRPPS